MLSWLLQEVKIHFFLLCGLFWDRIYLEEQSSRRGERLCLHSHMLQTTNLIVYVYLFVNS